MSAVASRFAIDDLPALLDAIRTQRWRTSPSETARALEAAGYVGTGGNAGREDWTRGATQAYVYKDGPDSVAFIELWLDVTPIDESDDRDALWRREGARYEAIADVVRRSLGEPSFSGAFGAPGYPEDHDAVHLTAWAIDGARLFLERRDDGPDFPWRLLLVIEPTA